MGSKFFQVDAVVNREALPAGRREIESFAQRVGHENEPGAESAEQTIITVPIGGADVPDQGDPFKGCRKACVEGVSRPVGVDEIEVSFAEDRMYAPHGAPADKGPAGLSLRQVERADRNPRARSLSANSPSAGTMTCGMKAVRPRLQTRW